MAERLSSVLLAGGGSAGHVSPLLALADRLRERDEECAVAALGTSAGLEARLVPARGYPLHTIPKVPLPRRPGRDLFRLPRNLRAAVAAAGSAIAATRAEVVVGFGGYVSTPAYLAARRHGIPIVIHEQNARPGLANRLGARLTPHVGVTFVSTRLPHARVVGMPLRPEISGFDRAALRPQALAAYGLDAQRPTLLVTGGSLGAARLNEVMQAAARDVLAAGIQVLHVTGAGKEFPAPAPAGEVRYVVVPYADRMELAYALADLALVRAGANTVCELTAIGLPGLYVPLPIGNGEQRLNAADVLAAQGGLLIDNDALSPHLIRAEVIPLLLDAPRLTRMGLAAESVGERGGVDLLADLVEQAHRGGHR